MSGWVKVEKDLESDPRVRRMAKMLCNASALQGCNASALQGVTLVIGGLTRLWMHADSHAREDDSLDMSTAEIDEMLGIPGFCALLPEDWLTVLDDHTVELPGFQAHNGVEAKKKALVQKRVTRHRVKQERRSVTARNALALPDQDQTKTKTKTRPKKKRAVGAGVNPSLELHDSLPQTEWFEWLSMRQKKHWPVDELTLRKQLELMAPHSTETQREILNYSMRAPYQGLFEPKSANGSGKGPRKGRYDELMEARRGREE